MQPKSDFSTCIKDFAHKSGGDWGLVEPALIRYKVTPTVIGYQSDDI